MKIINILQGIYLAQEKKMSKKSFHQKTRHTANAYLQDTAKYYGKELSGTILRCSIEGSRKENVQEKFSTENQTYSKCIPSRHS